MEIKRKWFTNHPQKAPPKLVHRHRWRHRSTVQANDPARGSAARRGRSKAPGARTRCTHHSARSRDLLVTAGRRLGAAREGRPIEEKFGRAIGVFPPGEKSTGIGAAADKRPYAYSPFRNRLAGEGFVDWMEKVSDEQIEWGWEIYSCGYEAGAHRCWLQRRTGADGSQKQDSRRRFLVEITVEPQFPA